MKLSTLALLLATSSTPWPSAFTTPSNLPTVLDRAVYYFKQQTTMG